MPGPEGELGLLTTEKRERHPGRGISLWRSSEASASCFCERLPLLPLLQGRGPEEPGSQAQPRLLFCKKGVHLVPASPRGANTGQPGVVPGTWPVMGHEVTFPAPIHPILVWRSGAPCDEV